jgi:PAT family beta-lactamase induction signal transducer AmpG
MSVETRKSWIEAIKPYFEAGPLASFFLGMSSGFPYAMIAATLTTRLKQSGIDKSTITAFSLAFLVYNAKPLWAWMIDGIRLPLLGRMGQRVSWMLFVGVLVMAAVANLALVDPETNLQATVVAAILVALAGATYDIVIDAYRIEVLEPYQLGIGSGMTQYGWRIGAVAAASLALVVAGRTNWHIGYLVCAVFALPAMLTVLVLGEPKRHREIARRAGLAAALKAIWGPFVDFFSRRGAWIVLAFILLHKIGDTLANLTLRLLFDDLAFSNDEIAFFDVGVGFWTFLAGIFVGGILYARMGLKRSVLLSLVLMAVSNLSFALLAMAGHDVWGLAGAIGFENFASGIGSVTVVAYFSALCDLRFTASQYALISAAASIVGRFVTGTTAGALIDTMGYVDFYLVTTVAALPGIVLFWWMSRSGLIDASIGDAGTQGGD